MRILVIVWRHSVALLVLFVKKPENSRREAEAFIDLKKNLLIFICISVAFLAVLLSLFSYVNTIIRNRNPKIHFTLLKFWFWFTLNLFTRFILIFFWIYALYKTIDIIRSINLTEKKVILYHLQLDNETYFFTFLVETGICSLEGMNIYKVYCMKVTDFEMLIYEIKYLEG